MSRPLRRRVSPTLAFQTMAPFLVRSIIMGADHVEAPAAVGSHGLVLLGSLQGQLCCPCRAAHIAGLTSVLAAGNRQKTAKGRFMLALDDPKTNYFLKQSSTEVPRAAADFLQLSRFHRILLQRPNESSKPLRLNTSNRPLHGTG